jgi:hypothetical protein
MQISLGEIVDRYSIVKLKSERTQLDCAEELQALLIEINKVEGLTPYFEKLYEVNGRIWDLESDIRKGKEKELGLEEVGRRAINIREINSERITIKNEINKIYNTGFLETKINHASEY